MDNCKPANRNWHLQLVTKKFFANRNQYNLRNPAWYIVCDNEHDNRDKRLCANSYDVLSFMEHTGGVATEIFGVTYNDVMQMDHQTYARLKKATYNICEQRAKKQEESERLEAERLRAEAAAARAQANRH